MVVTPLPRRPVIAVLVSLFANSMVMTMPFAFLPFMVRGFGVGETDVGYYSGTIASCMFLGHFITAYAWGKLADRWGRKAVIQVCTLGTALLTILFGFSTSLGMAMILRLLAGCLGGQVPATKTLLSEVTDDSNQALGMVMVTAGWGAGLVIGPAIGGFLSQPADKYPVLDVPLLRAYPYALPCFMCGVASLAAAVVGQFLFEETGARHRRSHDEGCHECHSDEKGEGGTFNTSVGLGEDGVANRKKLGEDASGNGFWALAANCDVRLTLLIYSTMSFGCIGFDEIFPVSVTGWGYSQLPH